MSSGNRKTAVVTIQFGPQDKVTVKMFVDDPIEKLIESVSKQRKIDAAKLKLRFDGEDVDADQTLDSLDIEDGEPVLMDAIMAKQ